ncbi:MAG: hypothetical protein A2711_09570 [Burkholderiales bacterium RIFCSPHIGHO2_01_FULL_63_240]|nr:MAG: hypothetical protein A2711_09570 [Burkholderiales bacterium RIFCSPHIGHO2_01_FULL_63_240]
MGNRASDVLAAKAGQRWVKQDYSKVDEVRDHLIRLGIDRVVPGCTDVSLETCVKLGKPWFLGDALEINTKLSDKAAFRRMCVELDLPAPQVVGADSFPLEGKFICKPVDAFSGRGISVFDGTDLAGLRSALALGSAESRSGQCVIETFCEGFLYSCSAFFIQGKIAQAFYVREGSSVNPYAVDTSYVDVDFAGEAQVQLEGGLQRLALHLQLTDGLLHTQFIVSDGKPCLVELTRRCPGDLYSLLIEFSTGIPYADHYASFFVGDSMANTPQQVCHVLRHTVTADSAGVYNGLRFIQPEPIKAFFPLLPVGESLLPRQGNRAGVLFSAYASQNGMEQAFERFMNRSAYFVV